MNSTPTIGSLFAGIGGFDLGFERAGWKTAWQVEINTGRRAVLAHRFPTAKRYVDVRHVIGADLAPVDCITAGFPCTDISSMGSRGLRLGLRGERSGLFGEALRIITEVRPRWIVLENVPALLHVNACQDIETIITHLTERDYVGFARVLNAAGFGVPQNRRRIFIVAGLGCQPPFEFVSDAIPVDAVPVSHGTVKVPRSEMAVCANTLLACTNMSKSLIAMGSEPLVAVPDGWDEMVDRAGEFESGRISCGLDDADFVQKQAAGDAVVPQIAEWIGKMLIRA